MIKNSIVCLGAVLCLGTAQGCADREDAEAWAAAETEVGEYPLISTYYDRNTRTIYAPDNLQVAGTPNVAITTRNIITNACRTTGPVVMGRLPAREITVAMCANVGLVAIRGAGGVQVCSSDRRTETPVYSYNFTSATQTQLNYEVREYGVNSQILNRSGWQPGGAGNGCPRP